MKLFFEKLLGPQRVPLQFFLDFATKWMLKNPKNPFYIFRHSDTVQKNFFPDIRLSQNISTKNFFFNTSRILEVEVRKYCAISELLTLYPNYIFTKEETEVQKQALLFVPARYISYVFQHAISELQGFRNCFLSFSKNL